MRWPSEIGALIDAAVTAARDGTPTLLAIQGEAGFGKSTLLNHVASGLAGFHQLRAFGDPGTQDESLALLREWDALSVGAEPPRHALQAWRPLAERIDRLQQTGPVAVVVDDLQWVDPDSVVALTALIQRAAGDRLLVVAAYRALRERHPAWRRFTDESSRVRVLRLTGLDVEAAAALVDSFAPGASPELAERLRTHTGGSPLHMWALLREHPAAELAVLAAGGVLPAPAELVAAVQVRLGALDPDAVLVMSALAVLGDGWSDLATVAAIAGVTDPDRAVRLLRAEDLLRIRPSEVTAQVRIAHAVIRVAAYDGLGADLRRRLHGAAAARLPGVGDRLRHRAAAGFGPDEGLAADLDRHAGGLHERGKFREAARYLRLAAARTPRDRSRIRRELDAQFDSVLAHDDHEVSITEADVSAGPQHRLVFTMRLVLAKQWVRAARCLDELTEAELAELDSRNRYRALVLRGWTIVSSGRRPETALEHLDRAAAGTGTDSALRTHFTFAYGQAMQATTVGNDELWGFESTRDIDRAELAATPEGMVRLCWRGSIYALTGETDRAIADLSVVTSEIGDGSVDFGDGVFHALLGFAQWNSGEWRRAAIGVGLALTAPQGAAHPIVVAVAPLAALVETADVDAVLDAVDRSRRARLAAPLAAAIHAGDIADVAVLAFAGTARQRAAWWVRRLGDFGDPRAQSGAVVPYLWLLAMGLAAAWDRDAGAVDGWADRLGMLDGGSWRAGAIAWLRALAARTRGERVADRLISVARQGLPGMASIAAVLWVDAAESATVEAHPEAKAVRAAAGAALTALGAAAYLPTMLGTATPTEAVPQADALAALSDREREVVALLFEGLSYAQIAKELYVTRSTVAFHLSNAYAKTGTASRHELVQLARVR